MFYGRCYWTIGLTILHFQSGFTLFLRRTEASNFFTPIIFVMTRISSHIFCILAPCSHPPCPGNCPSCPRDLRSQRAVEMFGPLFFIQAATKCCSCSCCCCCCCWRDALTHCHWNTHIKLSCTVRSVQSSLAMKFWKCVGFLVVLICTLLLRVPFFMSLQVWRRF